MIKQRQQGTTRLNKLRRIDLETRFPGLLETVLRAAEGIDLPEAPLAVVTAA